MGSKDTKTFVTTWVDAFNKKAGVPSVAEKLNISVVSASARANYLRKRGVNIPRMPRARRTNVTESLNALIEAKINN